ncbi:YSC84-related protein [Bizionia sediminis]|uniref:YSC84-related protein n=1 Tax=Bizionia sediminis TaxID=1737064 RepID=A0ABW5KPI4_9FLAO
MKTLKTMLGICLLFITLGVTAQNAKDREIMQDANKAKELIVDRDAGFEKLFNTAAGYAIFPNVGKGGLIIGGASGNGVLYENGMPVGMASVTEVSVGLQAGGQAVTEVIFFETEAALATFKQGNFEFAAGLSAVAITEGVSRNANYSDGVLVYTMPKAGLMANVSVGGQKFTYTGF